MLAQLVRLLLCLLVALQQWSPVSGNALTGCTELSKLLGTRPVSVPETYQLLRSSQEHPVARRLVELFSNFQPERDCRLEPLTSTKILLDQQSSRSLDAYLEHIEELRVDRCHQAGQPIYGHNEPPLATSEFAAKLLGSEGEALEGCASLVHLLQPFSLEPVVWRLIGLLQSGDSLDCKQMDPNWTYYQVFGNSAHSARLDRLVNECHARQLDFCKQHSGQLLEQFRHSFERRVKAKLTPKDKGELLQMLDKSGLRAGEILKMREWTSDDTAKLKGKYIKFGSKSREWSRLTAVCRLYLDTFNREQVQQFASIQSGSELQAEQAKYLASLKMCRNVLEPTNQLNQMQCKLEVQTSATPVTSELAIDADSGQVYSRPWSREGEGE